MSDSGIKKDDKDKGSIDGEPSKSMKKNIAVNKSITQSLKALNQRQNDKSGKPITEQDIF